MENMMSKIHSTKHGTLIFLSVLLFPLVGNAETVLRTGSDISVEAEQVVAGDYYVSVGPFSSTVMSGSVAEDMYALGAAVTVNGEVGTDATLFAGTVQVHAPIGDDLRVLGGEVTIADRIEGDVFVIGGTLSILSTASVGGDVFMFGGSASIEGDVDGSVFGKLEQITINSAVGGNVDVAAPAGVVLGDKAVIVGNVQYTSLLPLGRSPDATIEGEVYQGQEEAESAKERTRALLIPLFISLFTSLTLYLLFKSQLQRMLRTLQHESGKSLLVGAVTIIAGPVTAVVLMATVLGMFVGIALMALLLLLFVVSFALTGVVFGVMLLRLFDPQAKLTLGSILFGTLLLNALLFIPVAGIFALVVLEGMTLGALALMLYRAVQ
mgnify:CR=1 FL=1|tara:strand:+ start:285 stop:1424 length:1140 start_codon:yes stop_codon:yes gene_type:complete